ncbi:MAG: hypothetical protein IKK27_02430 [Alistipes sp.]|nr:hypothetical protein [Alistipes sp.]
MKEFLEEATSLAPAEIYANESRLMDFAKGMEAEYKHLTTWHDIVDEHPKESDLYLLRDAKLNISLGEYDVDTDQWVFEKEGRYGIKYPVMWRRICEI